MIVQEPCGTIEDLTELGDLLPRWRSLGAFLPEGGGSGILSLVSPMLAELYTDISQHIFVPGRMQNVSLRGGPGHPIDIWNVHLVPSPRLSVAAQAHVLGSSLAPLGGATTVILGDFKLLAPEEGRYSMVSMVTRAFTGLRGPRWGLSSRHFRDGALQTFSCTARYLSSPTSTTLPSAHSPTRVRVLAPWR